MLENEKKEAFLLGAGRPALGNKPAALKTIALNTRALDWQLHSLESVVDQKDISFLGGYQVQEIIDAYPNLKYQIIPDWHGKSVLNTFLKAHFSGRPVITTYTDTVFRKEAIEAMARIEADVVYAVDSHWRYRYASRSGADVKLAETIEFGHKIVEFTGLIMFSARAVKTISNAKESDIGSSLIDLVKFLKAHGHSSETYDLAGDWAEFNTPRDITNFILGTKSETLARLEPLVKRSRIGIQVSFSVDDWIQRKTGILEKIKQTFSGKPLIIRSSSAQEDNWHTSNAGGFESILNVDGHDVDQVKDSIGTVINSFGTARNGNDQILVQEFLSKVKSSGVVFSCDLETGAPYYRFNFDDKTQSTESVTAGTHNDLRTVVLSRFQTQSLAEVAPEMEPVLRAVQELEQLLNFEKLDVEFAVAPSGLVHIFQVRPIVVDHDSHNVDQPELLRQLESAADFFTTKQIVSPFMLGSRTILANMPDWNPAEIIGTHPKPLAFSLYRHLITNDIWATQRAEAGYRDVRPSPLISSLCGQPYVDTRASINSFVPANLPADCAARIVEAYIEILSSNPSWHDKLEFEVVFTIWTPGFKSAAEERLLPHGVFQSDICMLEAALKDITRTALARLPSEPGPMNELRVRRNEIIKSELPLGDKITMLIDDCKRFGTLPFAHAARAGFVAISLLKAFIASGSLTEERRDQFLKSIDTVSGLFTKDKEKAGDDPAAWQGLINEYGHLRMGTYEISNEAYWERPEYYLRATPEAVAPDSRSNDFYFTKSELAAFSDALEEMDANISPEQLTKYLGDAIVAREYVKFEFTRNLSLALDYCVALGKEFGVSRQAMSFVTYEDLFQVNLNVLDSAQLVRLLEMRAAQYATSRVIELPSLISRKTDIFCFERFASQPNFVGVARVEGETRCVSERIAENLKGVIVLIPQADPGYDWLFAFEIQGLITKYGGANSHMAIRAAETGLPAAIGVGEKLYEELSNASRIELDCGNQIVRVSL